MESNSPHRGRSYEDPGVAFLKIMRFMPVTIPVPLRIDSTVSTGKAAARPGVSVAVAGTITAGGFGARLTYRQREAGTTAPAEEVTSERIALLHDRTLSLPPRVMDRPAAGLPPDLWIQFLNGGGAPISAATRLGRCDQGPFDLRPDITLGLSVGAAILKTQSFDPYVQPTLAIAGEVGIRTGVMARFTLAETGGPAPIPGETAPAPADVPLFPGGTELQLPRRKLRGPVGRDSWIYLTFLDGTGLPTGGESLLGRAQPGAEGAPTVANDASDWGAYESRGGR